MVSGALLGDSPLADKVEAARVLGMLGDDNSYYSLFEGLQDSEPEVRKTCINSIVRHGRPDALQKIAEFLEDESPDVRLAAAAGLGNLGDLSTIELLKIFTGKESVFPVREAAIKSLNEIKYRLNKEEMQRLMEDKFRLELTQKDTEINSLGEKLKNLEALMANATSRSSLIETEFSARAIKNRKIMSYLLTGFTLFVLILTAGNFFVLRKVFVSRKHAVAEETQQLNSSVKTLQESLKENETALTASGEYYEKSEGMFKTFQKYWKTIAGKDPVAELLFEKVHARFVDASKLPVGYDEKMRVRENCITIAELLRKGKMDQAIDEFTKLDKFIEGLKNSAKNPAQ
jgi:hypothetical protein